ncbi:MAG: hypothetical protein AAGD14_17755 [Planctomycetota bacterium]
MRTFLILLLVVSPVAAGSEALPPDKKGPALRNGKVRKPVSLWGVRWYRTLDEARTVAQRRKTKPVLYVRVLGDLAGAT